jgi:RNA polymerase sigma-70 factor (ECF subfamily)
MNTATNRNLAMLAAQGNREAFSELVHRHQASVFNIAYRMLGNRGDAEDAAQEAFIRTYLALDSFDSSRPFSPWLKKIAVNVCLNQLKRKNPTPYLEDAFPPQREPAPGPEAQTIHRERAKKVRAAILALPPRYRAVIELRHFQHLSYKEISKTLERPLSDIKSDLFRARRMLADKLKELK